MVVRLEGRWRWRGNCVGGVADRMCPVLFILFSPCSANAGNIPNDFSNAYTFVFVFS